MLIFVLSFTGNAGPEVQDNRQVGDVYIALTFNDVEVIEHFSLDGERNQIRKAAVQKGWDLLERVIKEQKRKLFIVRRYIMAKETKNTLLDTIKEIEKTFGKGSVMKLGDRQHIDVDVIPSGSLLLDEALGVGGYPKGRIVEIFGPESSGKTTLSLHAIAECQKKVEWRHLLMRNTSIDPVYARNLGINIEELILSQPDSGEQALEIAEMLAASGSIDLNRH